jgi:predicted phosphodiesterase
LNAQPSLIHLSLQSEAKPGAVAPVTVTWCSDNTGGKQFIRYGVTSDPGKKVKTVKSEYGGKTFYKADLNKLKPGTRYFYKSGSDKEGWSPVYSFNSEPDTGTFRVGIFGDTQNNENNKSFEKTRIITDLLKTYSPSLTLHMGDIVNDGSQTESWFDFLSVTEDLNAVSPLMPVLGNHDVQNSTGEDFQKPFRDFYSLFNLPGDEINYSFTYGKVRFIGIFSGCAQAASEIDQVKYKPGSAEHIWLDEELTKAENEKNISWIIVWMHYPVNSFGWSNIAKWKENILPLLEKHRVDICLAGHRHVYERHLQAKNGILVKNKSRSTLNADDGTIFITNGTAGGNPTGPGGKDISTMAFTPDKTMYCFAVMDISNDSLTYSVFDHNNILVDRVIVNKQE